MKNVLFIVYYFPPMGGSGVQRPLKFVKYLREFGWNPIVLCPEPGAYHTFDDSLKKELDELNIEIHRVPGATPLHSAGNKKIGLPEPLEKLLRKISTFFWLPDNKKGWIKPGLDKALELIREKQIDLVFSTAAPYSNLLLASEIKKASGVKVVMDLRDEWLQSHLIKYPTSWHKKKMAQIEAKTLVHADVITVINNAYKESFGYRFPDSDIRIVEQGFDPGDFKAYDPDEKTDKIRLLYSGVFYGERSPNLFLKAVAEILTDRPELKDKLELLFQGGLSTNLKQLIKLLGLEETVKDLGYVDHSEAVKNLNKADVLWLMIGHKKHADKVTVGKMFEYFGTEKPILALIPNGVTKDMLEKYGAYYEADPFSHDEIKAAINRIIDDLQKDALPAANKEFVQRFNRKNIAGELASIFNVISS